MFGLEFRFENAVSFYYLWTVPVVVGVAVLGAKLGRRKLSRVIGPKALPNLISSVENSKRRWKLILQAVVVALLCITLARPQMGESKQEIRSEGVELMFVVDVSESMLAEDVRPNRLEQAKTELGKLIDMMAGSKIGIVAFAGSAALLSPLTSDPASLRMYLESLSTNSVSSQGTVFKNAIDEAAAGFKRGGSSSDETTKVTRVILIASDGEDHEPGALEEAKKLTGEGVRIFSLIYGTEKGAPIPERDGMGYLRGFKKDRSGQTVLTTVKGEALRALAEAGQGVALHASFGGTHLQTVVDEINKLEKTQFESAMAVQYDERFQIFAMLALLFLVIELAMGDRKNAKHVWQGRFSGSANVLPLLFFLGSMFLNEPAQAQVTPQVYAKNKAAIKAIEASQPNLAKDLLLQALAQDPLNAGLHFNLGLVFEAMAQPDNAKASYLTAIENAQEPLVLFSANFNLGLLAQKAKNKDEALKFYQEALKYNPESKETKINIELLTNKNQQQKGDGKEDPQDQEGDGKSDSKEKQDSKDGKEGDQQKDQQQEKQEDKPKQYGKNKPQPQQFKSQELSEGDVKKILGEIKQQEQKIRAEFNKKETKEQPQDKDW